MKNMDTIISSHNQQILNPTFNSYGCSCRDKDNCPLDGVCLTPNIIYRADVSNNKDSETKFYYGLTETSFKERYRNHKKSLEHERYRYDTELSKYVWELNDQQKSAVIKWSIAKKVNGKVKSDFCKLCLTEKYFILNALGDNKLLNRKSEFISKCRHQNKLFLSSLLHKNSMD